MKLTSESSSSSSINSRFGSDASDEQETVKKLSVKD